MKDEIDDLLLAVKDRYIEVSGQFNDSIQKSFKDHLRSLARWYAEAEDFPEVRNVAFPEQVTISYVVCHPKCGRMEYIVEGSTQECQSCGSLMYRTESAQYKLLQDK